MGLPVGRLVCTGCGHTQPSGIRPNRRRYQLEDGSTLPLAATTAWCLDCAGFGDAEDLSLTAPLEQLECISRVLASVSVKRTWFRTLWSYVISHWLDGEPGCGTALTPARLHRMGADIALARGQIAHRAARTAGARCLRCSGQRLIHAPFPTAGELRGFEHPGCGGIMFFEMQGLVGFGRPTVGQVYDADGAYLRDEELVEEDMPAFARMRNLD